jgi:hypothetical protein
MKADAVVGSLPAQRNHRPGPAKRSVPQRSEAFESVNLADLRRMRSGLSEEESRVSYWRRILQARLDLIRSKDETSVQVTRLAHVLADARVSHRRVAALSVEPVTDLAPLPDLAELWDRLVDENDQVAKQRLIDNLQHAEKHLSEYRRQLHERIDRVTLELIARYRENPDLALTALNERLIRR